MSWVIVLAPCPQQIAITAQCWEAVLSGKRNAEKHKWQLFFHSFLTDEQINSNGFCPPIYFKSSGSYSEVKLAGMMSLIINRMALVSYWTKQANVVYVIREDFICRGDSDPSLKPATLSHCSWVICPRRLVMQRTNREANNTGQKKTQEKQRRAYKLRSGKSSSV